eukprot:345926-Pelagomonas_calceolata.AAC.1
METFSQTVWLISLWLALASQQQIQELRHKKEKLVVVLQGKIKTAWTLSCCLKKGCAREKASGHGSHLEFVRMSTSCKKESIHPPKMQLPHSKYELST